MFFTREAEDSSKIRSPASMRSFKDSEKSQKTVKSMIETKGGDKGKEPSGKKNKNTKKEGKELIVVGVMQLIYIASITGFLLSFDRSSPAPAAEPVKVDQGKASSSGQNMVENGNQGLTADEIMQKKRHNFFRKRMAGPTEKPRQAADMFSLLISHFLYSVE